MDSSKSISVLTDLNSYRIHACCKQLLRPRTKSQLQRCIREYPSIQILAGGTNTILMEHRYEKLLLLSDNYTGFRLQGTRLFARAGTTLDALCEAAVACGLAGLENLSGIPGTVGGAVVMNAGAFGDDICSLVDEVIGVSRAGAHVVRLSRRQISASYRKTVLQNDEIVVACVKLVLRESPCERLQETRQNILAHRLTSYPAEPNAGSLFVRPSQGLPAGKMIEMLGLKGRRIGGAEVSRLHAGFCIARPGCTGSDIVKLAELIRALVLQEFGVSLELEQRMLFNVN
jgi:UDP-N-acetylmuramate dehydrogenase